jgi:hypothetical protein
MVLRGEPVRISAADLQEGLQAFPKKTLLRGAEVIQGAKHEALREEVLRSALIEETLVHQVADYIQVVHMELPLPDVGVAE